MNVSRSGRTPWLVPLLACAAVMLLAMPAGGRGKPAEQYARAPVGVSTEYRIQSDGKSVCSAQGYVEHSDPCNPGELGGVSKIYSTGDYPLRTLHNPQNNPKPERWLVLNFTDLVPVVDGYGQSMQCPDIDSEQVAPGDCFDRPEQVRFSARNAFTPNAPSSIVRMVIDKLVWMGTKRNPQQYQQWNAKYYLNFVNPLTIEGAGNTMILGAAADTYWVDLWTVNQKTGAYETWVGRYAMPFQVMITLVP
jgi:hypothetical protein